ncbi:MAG: SDR family NAD(P)-dependent oxidoreductase [Pigmentiphaga sp.]
MTAPQKNLDEPRETRTNLAKRVAIVTGAGQGIGAVYARYLAEANAKVIVADIEETKGEQVAAELRRENCDASFARIDVSCEASVNAGISSIMSTHGRIDILVNNAAIFSALKRSPFENISLTDWDRVMQVNVNGPFLMTRAVAPHMRANRYGRIVNVSSTTVHMGRPQFLHYVTSKAAILGMTRSLARELGQDGITVNAIVPTVIETGVDTEVVNEQIFRLISERQCIPRTGMPEDLANTLLFLVSYESGFITGQSVVVDGGGVHI